MGPFDAVSFSGKKQENYLLWADLRPEPGAFFPPVRDSLAPPSDERIPPKVLPPNSIRTYHFYFCLFNTIIIGRHLDNQQNSIQYVKH